MLGGTRRAIDICGGSGHLTRSLLDLSSAPPVLADLYFAKVWLARRFTAPGCEPVCCDGNAPMPFARGAFGFAMCTDAFMYIWTKRQFVGEMERLIDGGGGDADAGAVLIGHTHNERAWSPSHGQPLPPEGYAALFETLEPRIFGEAGLFEDVVRGGPLDLSRRDDAGDARPRPGADDHRQPQPAACSRRIRCRSPRLPPASCASIRSTPSKPMAIGCACGSGSRPRTTSRSTAPAGGICPEELTLESLGDRVAANRRRGRRAERSGPAEGDRRSAEAVLLRLS